MHRSRTAALAATLALSIGALTACGGSDSGAASAKAPAPPSEPTLAASQQLVNLVNRYGDEYRAADYSDDIDNPIVADRDAERVRGMSDRIIAELDRVVAHPCVESIATEQASVMRKVANMLQAAADGRMLDALAIGGELQDFDTAGMKRRQAACKARVGYRGKDDQ